MKITQTLLDGLTEQAKNSPRLRMNYDLRNGESDQSQRMLNAIEPGSVVPIHRHRYSSETVVCLRGRVVEEYYDDLGRMCEEAIEITPNGPVVALNIPIGQWHTIRLKESGSVFFVFVLDIQGQAPVLGYIALSGHRKSKHERGILPFAHCHNIFIRDNPCM